MIRRISAARWILRLGALSLALIAIALPATSFAKIASSEQGTKGMPKEVSLGVFVRSIHNINFKDSTAEIDIFLFAETKEASNPLDSLEILNAEIKNKSSEGHAIVSGEHVYSARLDLLVRIPYDLSSYPLDTQELVLIFEDIVKDNSQLRFVPHKEPHKATRVGRIVNLPGYMMGKPKIEISSYEHIGGLRAILHATPQGIPETITYSRATFRLPIKREGIGYYFKLLGSVFLAAAVAFLSFFIKPTNVDPRFGLGVAAIFAVVASNFVLSSLLPETHEISLGEAILFLTYLSIFATLTVSVFSLHLYETGKENIGRRLDLICGCLAPLIYAAATLFLGSWL